MGERRKRESPHEKKEKAVNVEKGLKAGKEINKKKMIKGDKKWERESEKRKKQAKGNMQKPVQK